MFNRVGGTSRQLRCACLLVIYLPMGARSAILDCLAMATEVKAIIFYRCNLFLFYFVSIDERPAMGS